MAVVAESWRDEGRLSKPGVGATVMSNLGLERHLASRGLTLERTAVGDRYVIEGMRRKAWRVGGEQSGHIILSDYSTTGDGLVAAMQVLAVVHKLGRAAEGSAAGSNPFRRCCAAFASRAVGRSRTRR